MNIWELVFHPLFFCPLPGTPFSKILAFERKSAHTPTAAAEAPLAPPPAPFRVWRRVGVIIYHSRSTSRSRTQTSHFINFGSNSSIYDCYLDLFPFSTKSVHCACCVERAPHLQILLSLSPESQSRTRTGARPGITFHFSPTHISTAHGGRSASSLSSASDAAVGTESGREGGRALFVVGLSLGRCRRCRRRDRERDGEETAGVGPRPRRSELFPREDCGIGGRPIAQA